MMGVGIGEIFITQRNEESSMAQAQRFHQCMPRLIALACALLCATVAQADVVGTGQHQRWTGVLPYRAG